MVVFYHDGTNGETHDETNQGAEMSNIGSVGTPGYMEEWNRKTMEWESTQTQQPADWGKFRQSMKPKPQQACQQAVQMSANAMMAQPLQQQSAALPYVSAQSTLNVFTGKPCGCGHGGMCNCSQQLKPPYLVVPREPQAAPLVRTEVEILRERVAAMEAQIVALTPPEPVPVPNVMARAISRWPGSQGFLEGIRWRGV